MRFERIPSRLITAATAAMLLAACGDKHAAFMPPTPEVGVVTLQTTTVPVVSELPGRTSALLDAQVRARVDGIVLRCEFTEGSLVKQGQRLYKIDPAPYIAKLEAAKASLAQANASFVSARALAERYKLLVASNAVSKQDYDNAVASEGVAAAQVASAKADVQTAQINLGYTDVVAPVGGQAGISQVTPGAYVQAGVGRHADGDRATARPHVRQSHAIESRRPQAAPPDPGRPARGERSRRCSRQARPRRGREYPEKGRLQFSDVTVDPSTGSVMLRAVFANQDRVLLPGMFVRARIEEGVNPAALVVPVTGISHDQKGTAVAMVIDKESKVAVRPLVTSGMHGQN